MMMEHEFVPGVKRSFKMTKDVSRWEIEELIKKGTRVYGLDKKNREVVLVNSMSVANFIALKEPDDSLFWINIAKREEK